MFRLLLACAVVAAASADVSHLVGIRPGGVRNSNDRVVAIVRQAQDIQPDGSYQFGYETDNGIVVEERAQVRSLGPEQVEKAAQGSYAYTSPEGEQISISYVADANGYQPQGSHLPVAPPIPVAIQRALEYIAAHPQPEHNDAGPSQSQYNNNRRTF